MSRQILSEALDAYEAMLYEAVDLAVGALPGRERHATVVEQVDRDFVSLRAELALARRAVPRLAEILDGKGNGRDVGRCRLGRISPTFERALACLREHLEARIEWDVFVEHGSGAFAASDEGFQRMARAHDGHLRLVCELEARLRMLRG